MDDFQTLKTYYDEDDFQKIIQHPRGKAFLKLRSISRSELLKKFAIENKIDISDAPPRQLFKFIFDKKIQESDIENFIKTIYTQERIERKNNEDWLYSQLYKLQSFNWGGLYQNSLEQTIVNNYIKKIQDFDTLSKKIENEIHFSLRGYVLNSWYNHWSSILIEDVFKDHKRVLPTVGLVKKVDFFWDDFPFDLKVTYFPEGFMSKKRQELGLDKEISVLKQFARKNSISYDRNSAEKSIFNELLNKIKESKSVEAKKFLTEFRESRKKIVLDTTKNPRDLLVWLYEEQGVRRFDSANRLFLILVNLDDLEESWKLKRNQAILKDEIKQSLDKGIPKQKNLQLKFNWNGTTLVTYSTAFFIFI